MNYKVSNQRTTNSLSTILVNFAAQQLNEMFGIILFAKTCKLHINIAFSCKFPIEVNSARCFRLRLS